MNVDGIVSVILQRTSEGLPPLKSRALTEFAVPL